MEPVTFLKTYSHLTETTNIAVPKMSYTFDHDLNRSYTFKILKLWIIQIYNLWS